MNKKDAIEKDLEQLLVEEALESGATLRKQDPIGEKIKQGTTLKHLKKLINDKFSLELEAAEIGDSTFEELVDKILES